MSKQYDLTPEQTVVFDQFVTALDRVLTDATEGHFRLGTLAPRIVSRVPLGGASEAIVVELTDRLSRRLGMAPTVKVFRHPAESEAHVEWSWRDAASRREVDSLTYSAAEDGPRYAEFEGMFARDPGATVAIVMSSASLFAGRYDESI